MACERHREDLLGAAAGWLEPEREPGLHAHLRACPACREEFQRQQRLFAAMEQGLRERVNEELPLGFAARVRARMNEQTAPRRRWILSWVPAWGAVAAAAALAAGLLIVHTLRHDAGRQENPATPVAHNVAPNPAIPVAHNVAPHVPGALPPLNLAKTPSKKAVGQGSRIHTGIAKVAPAQPEVLLPAGQKRAMARLVEGLRSGEVQGDLFLAENRELQSVQIAPLEIGVVELKPLEGNQPQPQ